MKKSMNDKEKVIINIEKFVLFHKDRIYLLKEFAKNKTHGRLIFQISFLGFESLAKLLYPEESDSGRRFISLLSIPNVGIGKDKATELYSFWRNSLIHQGFITIPWTTLETWGKNDVSFLSYPENKLRSSVEYPPESIIAVYKNSIQYLEDFFRNENVKEVEFYL